MNDAIKLDQFAEWHYWATIQDMVDLYKSYGKPALEDLQAELDKIKSL